MRYRVRGLTVRSENAAKTLSQPSKYVLHWISQLPPGSSVLDMGCGKLRYTIPLAKQVRHVTAVDSEVQVNRVQIIAAVKTTLMDYAKKYLPNVVLSTVDDAKWRNRKYDYVLCANVLSAIPSHSERLAVLRRIRTVLKKRGQLLAVVQYRNTYFRDYRHNPKAIPHRDGWLVKQGEYASFYALISPDSLKRLCKLVGFGTATVSLRGESAFVLAEAGCSSLAVRRGGRRHGRVNLIPPR